MNALDIALISFIAISALIGLRGFVKELFSLVAFFVAALIALRFSVLVEPLVSDWVQQPLIRYGLAALGLFVVALVVANICTNLLSKMVRAAGLGGTDRLLGFGFGVFRGILVLAMLRIYIGDYLFSNFPNLDMQVQTSAVMPMINSVAIVMAENFGTLRDLSVQTLLGQWPGGSI